MGTAVAHKSAYVHVCTCAQAVVSVFIDMWHGADILCRSVWLCKYVCVVKETTWLEGKSLDSGIFPVTPSQPCYCWVALFIDFWPWRDASGTC